MRACSSAHARRAAARSCGGTLRRSTTSTTGTGAVGGATTWYLRAVALREGGPQRVVAPDQFIERAAQRVHREVAAQLQAEVQVVERRGRVQALDEE